MKEQNFQRKTLNKKLEVIKEITLTLKNAKKLFKKAVKNMNNENYYINYGGSDFDSLDGLIQDLKETINLLLEMLDY